jgi:hypothetical protein
MYEKIIFRLKITGEKAESQTQKDKRMNTIFRCIVTLYLAGDWFMVIGYGFAGASMSTILSVHLIATVIAVASRMGVDTLM